MARYDSTHKEQTRRRILDTAGRRLKTDGVDGAGVKVLMSDAGLTNGAFYAHFGSKDDLVAAAVLDQLTTQRDVVRNLPDGPDAMRSFLRAYLSTAHRDDPAGGCPSGALAADIARSTPTVRAAYTAGLRELADAIAERLPAGNGRLDAMRLTASLIGTLQLARSVDDDDLSRALLDSTLDTLLVQFNPEDTP